MEQHRLIVFAGKPGVGKTTLREAIFPDAVHIDVLPFVMAYQNESGTVPEEKTILGYKDMYTSLKEDVLKREQTVVLELGTNHPDINIEELKTISTTFSVLVFLCTAPNDICRDRALARDRYMSLEKLEARLQRDFPNSFIKEIAHTSLEYHIIDTSAPLETCILKIKDICNKK